MGVVAHGCDPPALGTWSRGKFKGSLDYLMRLSQKSKSSLNCLPTAMVQNGQVASIKGQNASGNQPEQKRPSWFVIVSSVLSSPLGSPVTSRQVNNT